MIYTRKHTTILKTYINTCMELEFHISTFCITLLCFACTYYILLIVLVCVALFNENAQDMESDGCWVYFIDMNEVDKTCVYRMKIWYIYSSYNNVGGEMKIIYYQPSKYIYMYIKGRCRTHQKATCILLYFFPCICIKIFFVRQFSLDRKFSI